MSAAVITAIALLTLALGYLAGRLHGKAAHHRFMAEGWRYLDQVVLDRQPGTYTISGVTVSGVDVSKAFGSMRDMR